MNMKNEKGKMKSEKVWKSLLFTFSLLLFTFAANVAMAGAGVSVGTPQQRYPWNGKMDIPYTLTDTDAAKTYQLVTSLTVGGVSKAVTNELGQVADGGYTNTVDCAELFGTAVSNQTATVKLAVLTYAKPAIAVSAFEEVKGPFLIINLKADKDGNFQTTESDYSPVGAWTEKGGWADAYKRNYIVLRKVEAGTYPGYQSSTQINTWKQTAGYWIGVFEVTEAQYDRVMGVSEPSDSLVAKGGIRYDTIRGTSDPSATVAGTSFMTNLCAKCVDEQGNKVEGFDLPTEWQWNIAYCAGTTTQYYWGTDVNDADSYAWYSNSDWKKGSGNREAQVVGLKVPNAWGLYDIAGNVREWCRDVNGTETDFRNLSDADQYTTVGNIANNRPLRGGSFNSGAASCARNSRRNAAYDDGSVDIGFRLSRMSSK